MIKIVDRGLAVVLALLMALMVIDVTWQILTRFFSDSPSSFTEELARFLLIWIGLLGAAWAFRMQAHLGLSYLTDKLEAPMRRRVQLFSLAMSCIFALAVMVYGGISLVALTLQLKQVSPSLGWPIGYVYSVIPLSGLLICFYAIYFMIDPSQIESE